MSQQNEQNNTLLDLIHLNNSYTQGHSAMGTAEHSYYVVSWRGMESLQAYCTSELVHAWAGMAPEHKLREVRVENDGKQYDMKSWTDNAFQSHLVDALQKMGVTIKKRLLSDNSDEIYESVITNVYNGELDCYAFLEATISHSSPYARYNVQDAMRLDILRAKDGRDDVYARAGAYAYEKGLVPTSRLVNFSDPSLDEPESDDLMGQRYSEMNADDWLRKSSRLYMEQLMRDRDGDTYKLSSAKDVMTHINTINPNFIRRREDDWAKLVAYMQKNVVFMLNDKRASDRSKQTDWQNSYDKYVPKHIPQVNKTTDVSDNETSM